MHSSCLKFASHGQLDRFRAEEAIFSDDAVDASTSVAVDQTVTIDQTVTNDGTADSNRTVKATSETVDDNDEIIVDHSTLTIPGQRHSPTHVREKVRTYTNALDGIVDGQVLFEKRKEEDTWHLVDRILKCRWVKGQRFYLIKWQEKGAQSSWLPAKDISNALIDNYHKN